MGSTVIPILLASDKTKLTNLGGNKMAWPVYMSLGNLSMNLRSSPSTGSWMPIAYLPHCEWETELDNTQKDDTFHGICTSRLFHQVMKHDNDSRHPSQYAWILLPSCRPMGLQSSG